MTSARIWARRGLAAIGAVAALEYACAATSYRDRLTNQHFDEARQAIGDDATAWLATAWLGPRARMTIPALARLDAVARPDLRGVGRFVVLGLGDTWSDELDADLEDLPPPQPVQTQEVGPLVLTTYEQPAAGTLVDDLLADPRRLKVEVDGDRCKGHARRWRCTLGAVELHTAEIDFRPRRCLTVTAEDGATTRISAPDLATGNVLRGHVGFAGFNARLRSDAPAEIAIVVDGTVRSRFLATDAQGWYPFAVQTEPGERQVAIEITVAAGGTWGRDGYASQPPHQPCVELRAFSEGS